MPKAFDATNPPFDRLDPAGDRADPRRARHRLLPARRGHRRRGRAGRRPHVVIKGTVEEREGERAGGAARPEGQLRQPRPGARRRRRTASLAAEETLCYLDPARRSMLRPDPPQPALRRLLLPRDLPQARRLRRATTRTSASAALMRARVARRRRCSPAVFIDARRHASRRPATACSAINSNALFVRDGERIGIVTGMNLSKAVVLQRLPLETPVARPRAFRRGRGRRRTTSCSRRCC